MLKTRRQRSFWARIKLSMIISIPRRVMIFINCSKPAEYLLNWFTIESREPGLAGCVFMVKTLKNYLVSYFLPWSVKEQRRCVATVKMNILLSRTFVNSSCMNFMLFFHFFLHFFELSFLIKNLWNPETNALPAGPSDGKNDKVSPIIRTCHFVPRSDGSPLSLFPCVPQSVHLFHFNVQ